MDVHYSQEMQDLARHCPRLSKKLSSQEIRTLLDYIDDRVQQENADLLHKLTHLELSRDMAEKQYSRTLTRFQKESAQDKDIVEKYKRSFGNISQVLANKEERFEGKYQNALKEIASMEDSLKKMDRVKFLLQEDNERKDALIGSLHLDIDALKKNNEERADYYEVVKENSLLNQQILRLKLDLDQERKSKANLSNDIDKFKEQIKGNLTSARKCTGSADTLLQYPTEDSSLLKSNNLWYETKSPDLSRRGSIPGFKMASPVYQCHDVSCRASRDLIQCRAHLVKQCEENARLQQLLSNTRKRQQYIADPHLGDAKSTEPIRETLYGRAIAETRFPEFRKVTLQGQRDRSMSMSTTYPKAPTLLLSRKYGDSPNKVSYRK